MANWWTLKILSGNDAGRIFKLKSDRTLIGRIKGDVVLKEDEEASRVHAEITYDGAKGVLVIEDLRSRNGVRVNGKRVNRCDLAAGDRVKIGATEMLLEPPALEETAVRAYSGETSSAVGVAAVKSARSREESRAVERNSLIRPHDYNGYLAKFFGVFFHPVDFFGWMGEHTELAPAIKFGAINWLAGGVLSAVLSYLLTYVWKVTPPGPDYGNSPVAIVLSTLVGFAAIPFIAGAFHGLCLAVGGQARFQRAVQITCFVSAVHFLTALASTAPKVGLFFVVAGAVYSIFIMTVAAIRIYHVTLPAAYAVGSVISAIVVAVLLRQQMSAKRLGVELMQGPRSVATEPSAPVVRDGDPVPPGFYGKPSE